MSLHTPWDPSSQDCRSLHPRVGTASWLSRTQSAAICMINTRLARIKLCKFPLDSVSMIASIPHTAPVCWGSTADESGFANPDNRPHRILVHTSY
jgi:hypothetical protein